MTLDEVRAAAETGEVIEARLCAGVWLPSTILFVGSPAPYVIVMVESTFPNKDTGRLSRPLDDVRKVPE